MSEARDTDREVGLPSSMPPNLRSGGALEQWARAAPPAETYVATREIPPLQGFQSSAPIVPDTPYDRAVRASGQTPAQPAPQTNVPNPAIRPTSHAQVTDWWVKNANVPQHVAEGIADNVNRESSFRPDLISQDTGGPSGGLYQAHLDRLSGLQQNPNWRDPNVQHQWALQQMNGGDLTATQHRNEIFAAKTREEARDLFMRYFERPAAAAYRNTTAESLPGFQQYQQRSHTMLEQQRSDLNKLMEEALKEPPGSAERHKKLQESMDKSAALQDQFREIAQNPPTRKPTDFMSTFGSIAMLVAAIGGRRSMQPATAALQAAAGVIEGVNANNDKEFDRAYKVWQTQSKLLESSIGMQSDTFKEILDDARLSDTERHTKLLEAFRLYDMRAGIDAVERGDLETAYKLAAEVPKQAANLEHIRAQTEASFAAAEASRAHAKYYEQGGAQKSGLPQWQKDIVERKQKEYFETNGVDMPTDVLLETIRDVQTKPITEYQRGQLGQAATRLEETKRVNDARIDDMVGKREISRDRAEELKRMDSARIEDMASRGLIRQQEANERHRMDDARIEDMVDKRELSHTKAIELRRMDDARIQNMADRGEITKERAKDLHDLSGARIKALERGPGEPVDEDTVQYWGERVRRGEPLPATYRDAETKKRIMVAAAHGAGIQGSPHTAGEDLANKAALRSDTLSMGQLTKIADAAEAYENTALKNIEIVKQTMPKGIGLTGIPALDRWVQTGRVETGDPNVPPYQTALVTVANEYAKVMEGSTGSQAVTVSAREEAAKLLNQAQTKDQVTNVLGVMVKDMENKKAAYKDQRKMISDRISVGGTTGMSTPAGTPAAAPEGARPAIKYDAQGNRVQ